MGGSGEATLSEIQGRLTLFGKKTPIGSFRYFDIEVPAVGPQIHPLNDSDLFGIYQCLEESRFAALFANREIWFEVPHFLDDNRITAKFVGLKVGLKVSFTLYVRAEKAMIGERIYLPKTLNKYAGGAKAVSFKSKGRTLVFISKEEIRMELIPLAGVGSFWDSDFLLAYEIPLANQIVDLFLECH